MSDVLIAPVIVTPTKPLTPSHVKGLLWVDVMYRATSLVARTTYRYSLTTYNTTAQTLGFWEYLDRTFGDADYSSCTEEEIGELYVRHHQERERAGFAALRPYLRAVEETGWIHPASARLIELWSDYYRRLGMHNPGLDRHQPPPLAQEELVELLTKLDLCLDNRPSGGAVYLDATRHGLPLRPVISAEDQPNYLVGALRELVPLATVHDETVLVHDPELTPDFVLLQKTLETLGAHVVRVSVGRVPIDGVVRSSRHGGWQGYALSTLLAGCAGFEPDVLRLGIRLYFIAVLGKGGGQSFRSDLLEQTLRRARRLLAADTPRHDDDELVAVLDRYRRGHGHVDPYRLTCALLGRHRTPPVRDITERVYC